MRTSVRYIYLGFNLRVCLKMTFLFTTPSPGIKPAQFQTAFIRWTNAINKQTGGILVAIDGKTLHSSCDREDRISTIHMVSAYAAANKVVLGQIKTAEKSNEITAIPELLTLLDITGCLLSIDAMGCQTQIAKTIVE